MRGTIVGLIATAALAVAGAMTPTLAGTQTIYDSIAHPLPQNVTSEGYECCTEGQVGDEISFGGTYRQLGAVTVTMSNWAYHAAYPGFGDSTGFTVPLKLNLYNIGSGGSVGSLIASRTINALIAWRPDSDGCGPYGTGYFVGATCWNGLAQNVTFDFSGVTVPDQVTYGLAFNTQNYGANPTGQHGPYDSLNFGLTTSGPSIGIDDNTDQIYRDGTYNRHCGTGGTFNADCNWSPYTPMIAFTAVPEPATLALLGAGLIGLAGVRRRSNR